MIYCNHQRTTKTDNKMSDELFDSSKADRRNMQKTTENQLIHILEAELVKALGCTEPIAIAYASAVAKKYLGAIPEKITVSCSGNMIKNAKAVVVPITAA